MTERFTALIIGPGGGFGGAVARELLARGHRVKLGCRRGREVRLAGAENVEVDALDRQALLRAAQGVDVIVYGFSVPYPRWETTGIEAAEICAAVAAETSACVLFPGNVYGLGPDFSAPIVESAPREAVCRKGAIRNRIEASFERATQRGPHAAQVIVLRAGDFFGPHCTQTWFVQMTQRLVKGGPIVRLGPPGVPHAWAYLPDMARAGAELLERRSSLERFAVFHFAGYAVDSDAMIEALRRVWRDSKVSVAPMRWWLLRAAAPFVPLAREAWELRYLWTEPVLLDDSKLRQVLPTLQITPLESALAVSLGRSAKVI